MVYDANVPLDAIREAASSADMPEGLIGPVTGVPWYDGLLYISHRGRVSTLDPDTGEFTTIVNRLPSWGFFHNNKVIFGPDGKMDFFLSTQGNAGPIDEHWSKVINAYNKPEAHEVPCQDVTLTGENFAVPVEDPDTPDVDDTVLTGVYVPLGTETQPGQTIAGEVPCNGAFLRANPDGTDLGLVAWGLRSDFTYRFAPDGRLIATQNCGNPIAPREIHDDWETVYAIEEGAWYGWPDYFSGVPVTDPRFAPKMGEHRFVLTEETHRRLLGDREAPPEPLVRLQPHVVALGFVFGRPEFGLSEEEILLAEFGANGVGLRDRLPEALLAVSRATHFPINAPLLYVDADGLPSLTRDELLRWEPEGVAMDGNTQVYLVGDIGAAVREEIEALGYQVRALTAADPIALSEVLDTWTSTLHGDHENVVAVANLDRLEPAIPSAFWNAHAGDGLVFVTDAGNPETTRRILERRAHGPWLYLFGDETVISNETARELAQYGTVTRIPKADPSAASAFFADFGDSGEDWGFWVDKSVRDFGWDNGDAGRNAIFVNLNGPGGWANALNATTLSHMGKHGPALVVDQNDLPTEIERYLRDIQPYPTAPQEQLLNHGWIIGGEETISWENQARIDLLLEGNLDVPAVGQ